MTSFTVTRAHLKQACDRRDWDLLDRLLEISAKHINYNAFYTDSWGDWWGLLLHCVYEDEVDGVRVLLKHGAKKHIGRWGDGLPMSPLEAAADKPAILALLKQKARPTYTRQTDPPLPQGETAVDRAINRQGEIHDQTGLVFPPSAFE